MLWEFLIVVERLAQEFKKLEEEEEL